MVCHVKDLPVWLQLKSFLNFYRKGLEGPERAASVQLSAGVKSAVVTPFKLDIRGHTLHCCLGPSRLVAPSQEWQLFILGVGLFFGKSAKTPCAEMGEQVWGQGGKVGSSEVWRVFLCSPKSLPRQCSETSDMKTAPGKQCTDIQGAGSSPGKAQGWGAVGRVG